MSLSVYGRTRYLLQQCPYRWEASLILPVCASFAFILVFGDVIIIAKSDLFPALPDVDFAQKDPDAVTREVINLYAQITGRELGRADPVRLFLDAVILAIIQQRNIIDFSAKQNLLAYAEGQYLDHLGALLGVKRLDGETDEPFRERIMLAPESFSVAGPKQAYAFYAKSADAGIIDVAVVGPPDTQPGYVDLYPLMTGGTLPDDGILQKVYAACNADNIRPDTDFLSVKVPVVVNYTLDVTFYIDEAKSSIAGLIEAKCREVITDWVLWQRSKLGRDINPSELTHRLVDAGAKRADVRSPAFRVLRDWELAVCASESVTYGGLERG